MFFPYYRIATFFVLIFKSGINVIRRQLFYIKTNRLSKKIRKIRKEEITTICVLVFRHQTSGKRRYQRICDLFSGGLYTLNMLNVFMISLFCYTNYLAFISHINLTITDTNSTSRLYLWYFYIPQSQIISYPQLTSLRFILSKKV